MISLIQYMQTKHELQNLTKMQMHELKIV